MLFNSLTKTLLCYFKFLVYTGRTKYNVTNTILFVAFDFEEATPDANVRSWPYNFDFGSHAFVTNITSYLSKTGGTIGGAIILETMANHDSSPSMCKYFQMTLHIFASCPMEFDHTVFRQDLFCYFTLFKFKFIKFNIGLSLSRAELHFS